MAYATFDEGNDDTYTAPAGPGVHAATYRFVDKATGQQMVLAQLNVLGVTLRVVRGGEGETAKPAPKAA